MSASSGVVMTLGALVSSPVAWLLYDGEITLDEAMIRIGICLTVVWIAVSVVSAIAFSPTPIRKAVDEQPGPDAPAPPPQP